MVFFNPLLHRLFLNNIEKFQEKFKLSFEFFCKNAPFSIIFSNMWNFKGVDMELKVKELFEKYQQMTKSCEKLPSMQRVKHL